MSDFGKGLLRGAAEQAAITAVDRAVHGRQPEPDPEAPRAAWWRRHQIVTVGAVILGPLALLALTAAIPLVAVVVLGHPLVWLLATAAVAYGLARRRDADLTPDRWVRDLRQVATGRHRRSLVVTASVGAALGAAIGASYGLHGYGWAMTMEAVPSLALIGVLVMVLWLRRWRP